MNIDTEKARKAARTELRRRATKELEDVEAKLFDIAEQVSIVRDGYLLSRVTAALGALSGRGE